MVPDIHIRQKIGQECYRFQGQPDFRGSRKDYQVNWMKLKELRIKREDCLNKVVLRWYLKK